LNWSSAALLTPELCLGVFAVLVILLDLFIDRKRILAAVTVVGLLASMGFSLSLWLGWWGLQTNAVFGGMLMADDFALFFKVLLAAAAILVVLASVDYSTKFSRFQGEYYALILLSAMGMMLMAASRDLISIYVALELTSLSLYALVGFLKNQKSTEASLKYLLLGAVASASLLFGMALVFGFTGETSLAGIAAVLPAGRLWATPALLLGVVFIIAGLGFKISSVPFQMWVPDVYEGAPTPITAYLSIASKAAGFAVILRVFLEALGSIQADWVLIFAILSALSMVIGNVVAIAQTNVKRMLGYSTIAQAGYLMVGLATVTVSGQSGLLFFLASYAVANLGAFIAIIAISEKTGSDLISDFSGMGKRAPVLALALTLCLLSLTGIPPTAGFVAKLYLFSAAVQHNLVWLVLVAVLNTAISAYYYFRVVKVMWFSDPVSEEGVPSPWALRVALALACLGVLVLFFYPGGLLGIAQTAVATLP